MAFGKTKQKNSSKSSSACMSGSDITEKIRAKAYELFLKRGKAPGHAMEDWIQAEREVRARNR